MYNQERGWKGPRQKRDLVRAYLKLGRSPEHSPQPGPSELSREDHITVSMKPAAEKQGLDKEEPGKIQILPDVLSLQPPEVTDFYLGKGRRDESPARIIGHTTYASAWLVLLSAKRCAGRAEGAKDFLISQIQSMDLREKHNTKLVFPKSPSDQGFLETRTGLPAAFKVP